MASSNIYLQLGDIIKIQASTNPELNEKLFFIEYISSNKIKLIPEESNETIVLNIKDGNLTDESITSITIVSRAKSPSYAKQKGLLPGTWISIYFGGSLPLTINGEITNLEEDMIEITTYPDKDIIYIDFSWKGIPDDIPIDKIVIMPPPEVEDDKQREMKTGYDESKEGERNIDPHEEQLEWSDQEEGEIYEPVKETINIPVDQVKTHLKEIILDANQINFGPKLEAITQIVEVPEDQKRYSIDTQTNDLLDELLSSIPNIERTRSVMNRIHVTIERFKQLRMKFSKFDQNGNAILPQFKGADYKPLIDNLMNLNFKLHWILPIAQNMKKLYDIDITQQSQASDIIPLTLAQSLIDEYDIRNLYTSSSDNYSIYMNKLQPYLTPFENDYNTPSLITETISQNMDIVIDNLGKFYSSIAKNDLIKQRRFLITRYNLGLSKLQPTQMTSTVMKTNLIPMTKNDTISVKSILTLPEPVVQFSKITLPKTSIFDKSNLNLKYLQYWKLFRDNTIINTKYIDNLNNEKNIQDTSLIYDNYLKYKTEYILSEENNDPDKYKKYLDIVIPKTRFLFNMIKKYIHGKLTFLSVIDHLQPFLIYIDDLTFKQYEEITEYISEKILEYKKQYANSREIFNKLSSDKDNHYYYESILYKILKSRQDNSDDIFKTYGFSDTSFPYKGRLSDTFVLSPSEILTKMSDVDYTKLYNTAVALVNTDLFTPFDFDDLLSQKKEEINKNIEEKETTNECKQYELTKRYISLEELNADNDIRVYVDKKYDDTVYDILNEYKLEQTQMDDSTFKNFLIDELIKNIGLKKSEAKLEAKYMIDGKREVQEGQYAVLEIDNIDNIKYYYYKRENNTWVRDESISTDSFFGTNNLFCNIQEKCIKIDKTCADKSLGSDLTKQKLIKEMYDEFDYTYNENVEQYNKNLTAQFNNELERCIKLRRINNFMLYKYNNKHVKFSADVEDSDIVVSPFKKKLNVIMSYSDIVIKYNELVKFINNHTRSPIEITNEDKYWLYCIETDVKIVPTFIQKLATVFVENGNYMQTLEQIKNEQGVDIDNIIFDKYSGWEISKITLNTDEGYDETGRKVQSKEIMEKDAGAIMLQSEKNTPKELDKLIHNPKGKIVNNVLTSMSNYLGIILNNEREEIIKHVLLALEETVDTQEVYEREAEYKLKNGIKTKPYLDIFNVSLLVYTLSYLALYIVVSIPSIQSKKAYPGCKRSFNGYPLTGDEDLTNLEYIACVASGIKTSQYPWKTLPKNKDKIMKLLKNSLDAYILKQPDIQVLIEQKKNYLLQNEDDLIPIELDIKNWINFLPPLQPITNSTPANISPEFRELFLENLKKGSSNQFNQIHVIHSKIIYFSMAVIQSIQKVVDKEKLLLMNKSEVPYLQNACCNSGEYKTIDYFSQKEPNIVQFNTIVNYLSNIMFDMENMAQPAMLLDSKNTKIKFPTISKEFSEETIYKAFIQYCNFNSDIPIPNKLIDICLNKPDEFEPCDNVKTMIEQLKQEGKEYSLDTFNELLDIVNKMNIVSMDLDHSEISDIHKMRDFIAYLKETENVINKGDFLDLFGKLLDTYDIITDDNNIDMRNLINYLDNQNEEMMNTIINYIDKHGNLKSKKLDDLADFMNNISIFNENENNNLINRQDETLYRSIQYIKNTIFNFIYVFPTIIMNDVDYSDIDIPKHWKLSDFHKMDVKNIIKDNYTPLKRFYKDTSLFPLFIKNQTELKDFIILVNLTHLYANIILPDKSEITSILNNKVISHLFKFYFLFMINNIIRISTDKNMLKQLIEQPSTEEEEIIITSIESQEDLTGEITEINIIRGEHKRIQDNIANVMTTLLEIEKKYKQQINLNISMIKEKINRSKDKERHNMTTRLRDMSKEERKVENLFKTYRLEKWGKGLQKGLTQYVAKTYDEEREDRERDEIMNRRISDMEMLGEVHAVNREIEMAEQEQQDQNREIIENDVYNMDDVINDDDMGDYDDVYALQYDDNED
jgi:hypothetical protein